MMICIFTLCERKQYDFDSSVVETSQKNWVEKILLKLKSASYNTIIIHVVRTVNETGQRGY